MMLNPMRVIQYDDYSDLTLKFENFENMPSSIDGFFIPQHIMKNDHYNLKLTDL